MNHPAQRMDCKPTIEDATWVQALCFGAVFIGSLLLRLHDIGSKPFWIDEVVTVHRASLPMLHLIGDSLRAHHMPAFFVVTSWVPSTLRR